jgi:ribonuclease D
MDGVRIRDRDRTRVSSGGDLDFRWVDTAEALDEVLRELKSVERYAIDTEFHRERTYFPALALIQLAWNDEIAIVDPTVVDSRRLVELFDSDVEAVFHAAQQDLDVLGHAVGTVPRRIFDTQIAGGFLGYGTPSLAALSNAELGITPAKGDRLTDWLRRPLTPAQLQYAAADVANLLEIRDRLTAKLGDRGRIEWALEAIEELRTRRNGLGDPDDAWLRLKDVRGLKARSRAVAQSVAAWRERRAMRLDVPVRQVLPDLAILGIAQRQPTDESDLAQARGVDGRVRGSVAAEVLAAVAAGRDADPPDVPSGGDDLDRELRPAVTLISAWVAQVARDQEVDTAILATRADLVALLSGDPSARLARGWRAELLGDDIRALVQGSAALTFVPGVDRRPGGLRLVRSDPVG